MRYEKIQNCLGEFILKMNGAYYIKRITYYTEYTDLKFHMNTDFGCINKVKLQSAGGRIGRAKAGSHMVDELLVH